MSSWVKDVNRKKAKNGGLRRKLNKCVKSPKCEPIVADIGPEMLG